MNFHLTKSWLRFQKQKIPIWLDKSENAACGVRLTASTSLCIRGVVLFVETTAPICLRWGSLGRRIAEQAALYNSTVFFLCVFATVYNSTCSHCRLMRQAGFVPVHGLTAHGPCKRPRPEPEMPQQPRMFVDGVMEQAAQHGTEAWKCRRSTSRRRLCLVPPKIYYFKKKIVTSNLRYMHGVLNVDEIKN
jgi:hypothetical protein